MDERDERILRIAELEAKIVKLQAQLPKDMEDCTIEFKECELGHGRLMATNWVDHGCPYCHKGES